MPKNKIDSLPRLNRGTCGNDMWAKLAREQEKVCGLAERPPDSFTVKDFMQRFGFSDSRARKNILKLIAAGKVQDLGKSGRDKFYRLAGGLKK